MKILIIGNIGSGKTTLAKNLVTRIEKGVFIPLDYLRELYGDGTISKEYFVLSKFTSLFEAKQQDKIMILEFTGAGLHKHAVLNAIKRGNELTIVIYVKSNINSCQDRIQTKTWDIPYPWQSPAEQYIPLIHQELEKDWKNNFWRHDNTRLIKFNSEHSISSILKYIKNIINETGLQVTIRSLKTKLNPLEFFDIITNVLSSFVALYNPLQAFLAFGSYARGTSSLTSDVDYAMIYNSKIDQEKTVMLIKKMLYYYNINVHLTLSYRDKIIFYVNNENLDYPYNNYKIEIYLIQSLAAIKTYIIGSKLTKKDLHRALIYTKDNSIKNELVSIIDNPLKQDIKHELIYHTNRSIESFTLACTASQKSDYYRFYFHLNILFHHILILRLYLRNKDVKYPFLPKYAHHSFNKNELKELNDLMKFPALIFHDRSKTLKNFRKELNKIIEQLQDLFTNEQRNQMFKILETSFDISLYRNFRDIAMISYKHIKPNVVYRSAALSILEKNVLLSILKKFKIKTIIDLRSQSEQEEKPYDMEILKKANIQYFNVPFSLTEHETVDQEELINKRKREYHAILTDFKSQIKRVFSIIAVAPLPIIIHCNAGKDRTGVIIALLYSLLNVNTDLIEQDYIFSERDTKLVFIRGVLQEIDSQGGILSYFRTIGMTLTQLNEIKKRISTVFLQ